MGPRRLRLPRMADRVRNRPLEGGSASLEGGGTVACHAQRRLDRGGRAGRASFVCGGMLGGWEFAKAMRYAQDKECR
jgi:hypothetical protein